ncbi:MAG: polysaccharide export outer membrane protein [Rhodothermales bacterium]|jgi:polysaccharide export outer membrane protein
MGIDLRDPIRASQRARELGVPDEMIRSLLAAYDSAPAAGEPSASVVGAATQNPPENRETVDEAVLREAQPTRNPRFFGYNIFEAIPDAFQPDAGAIADDQYVLGSGDEVRLVVWGGAEFQHELTVDPGGRIFVPRVGQLVVAGTSLTGARDSIKRFLSQRYTGLVSDPATVFMDLTLVRLRPLHVFAMGEVARPGGYTIAAGSSLFSLLYSVGGPLTTGSLRELTLVRNGRRIATLDLYDYLMAGFAGRPSRLQSGDFLFVPPRGTSVTVEGQVRRPAIFELREGESFIDLLEYAGGLLPDAYGRRIQVERILPLAERSDPVEARTILDLALPPLLSGAETLELSDGDLITVFSISDRLDNAVRVEGAVEQPGRYELSDSIRTVWDVVLAADGPRRDAHLARAELIRQLPDRSESLISIDLSAAMLDDPRHNIPLQKRDQLRVFAASELQSGAQVTISGSVLRPGPVPYRTGIRLSDLLFAGGGLEDSLFVQGVFLERADLFRPNETRTATVVVPFNLGQALAGVGMASETLRPGDEVRIYPRRVEDIVETTVQILGSVRAPGSYRWREGLTLEDLLIQAGGFQPNALLESAEVTRSATGVDQLAEVVRVPLLVGGRESATPDSLRALFRARSYLLQPEDRVFMRTDPEHQTQRMVSISGRVAYPGEYTLLRPREPLSSLLARAGGLLPDAYLGAGRLLRGDTPVIVDFDRAGRGEPDHDVVLVAGDKVYIPQSQGTIQVNGNVYNPGLITHLPGKRLRYYLDQAGGLGEEVESIFVTNAAGAVRRVRRGLIPANPVIYEGGVVRVTRKPAEQDRPPVDFGSIARDVLSVAGSVVTVIVLAGRL